MSEYTPESSLHTPSYTSESFSRWTQTDLEEFITWLESLEQERSSTN